MNKPTKAVATYIISRAKEPSTWRGLALIATMLGAPVGAVDSFVQVGLLVVGLLGTLPDKH